MEREINETAPSEERKNKTLNRVIALGSAALAAAGLTAGIVFGAEHGVFDSPHRSGVVVGRTYHPEHTDHDSMQIGHVAHPMPVTHPEEFDLEVREDGEDQPQEVPVSKNQYQHVTNGSKVDIDMGNNTVTVTSLSPKG